MPSPRKDLRTIRRQLDDCAMKDKAQALAQVRMEDVKSIVTCVPYAYNHQDLREPVLIFYLINEFLEANDMMNTLAVFNEEMAFDPKDYLEFHPVMGLEWFLKSFFIGDKYYGLLPIVLRFYKSAHKRVIMERKKMAIVNDKMKGTECDELLKTAVDQINRPRNRRKEHPLVTKRRVQYGPIAKVDDPLKTTPKSIKEPPPAPSKTPEKGTENGLNDLLQKLADFFSEHKAASEKNKKESPKRLLSGDQSPPTPRIYEQTKDPDESCQIVPPETGGQKEFMGYPTVMGRRSDPGPIAERNKDRNKPKRHSMGSVPHAGPSGRVNKSRVTFEKTVPQMVINPPSSEAIIDPTDSLESGAMGGDEDEEEEEEKEPPVRRLETILEVDEEEEEEGDNEPVVVRKTSSSSGKRNANKSQGRQPVDIGQEGPSTIRQQSKNNSQVIYVSNNRTLDTIHEVDDEEDEEPVQVIRRTSSGGKGRNESSTQLKRRSVNVVKEERPSTGNNNGEIIYVSSGRTLDTIQEVSDEEDEPVVVRRKSSGARKRSSPRDNQTGQEEIISFRRTSSGKKLETIREVDEEDNAPVIIRRKSSGSKRKTTTSSQGREPVDYEVPGSSSSQGCPAPIVVVQRITSGGSRRRLQTVHEVQDEVPDEDEPVIIRRTSSGKNQSKQADHRDAIIGEDEEVVIIRRSSSGKKRNQSMTECPITTTEGSPTKLNRSLPRVIVTTTSDEQPVMRKTSTPKKRDRFSVADLDVDEEVSLKSSSNNDNPTDLVQRAATYSQLINESEPTGIAALDDPELDRTIQEVMRKEQKMREEFTRLEMERQERLRLEREQKELEREVRRRKLEARDRADREEKEEHLRKLQRAAKEREEQELRDLFPFGRNRPSPQEQLDKIMFEAEMEYAAETARKAKEEQERLEREREEREREELERQEREVREARDRKRRERDEIIRRLKSPLPEESCAVPNISVNRVRCSSQSCPRKTLPASEEDAEEAYNGVRVIYGPENCPIGFIADPALDRSDFYENKPKVEKRRAFSLAEVKEEEEGNERRAAAPLTRANVTFHEMLEDMDLDPEFVEQYLKKWAPENREGNGSGGGGAEQELKELVFYGPENFHSHIPRPAPPDPSKYLEPKSIWRFEKFPEAQEVLQDVRGNPDQRQQFLAVRVADKIAKQDEPHFSRRPNPMKAIKEQEERAMKQLEAFLEQTRKATLYRGEPKRAQGKPRSLIPRK